VNTVEGAIQAGIGFVVISQLLSYLPGRAGSGSLTVLLFALGALTYARHPKAWSSTKTDLDGALRGPLRPPQPAGPG